MISDSICKNCNQHTGHLDVASVVFFTVMVEMMIGIVGFALYLTIYAIAQNACGKG